MGATRERVMLVHGAPVFDLGGACAARAAARATASLLSEPLHRLQAFTHPSLLAAFGSD